MIVQVIAKLLAVAVIMAICPSTFANIVWMRTQGDVDVSISYSGGKYYATITSSVNGGSVEFWSTSNGSDTIGYIRNTASGTSVVGVKVRANPSNGYLVHTVEEISETTNSKIVLYECTVAHDIGDVDVWAIGTLDAGGDIYGWIQSNATNITQILASGDIVGSITALYGRILGIRADGSIGTSGSPVSITAKERIDSVIASSVHTYITVTGTTGGDGGFGRLEATSGDVTGTLDCLMLVTIGSNRDIVVSGDLDMDVTAADHISQTFSLEAV